ncbi:hypothetical protein BOO86_18380 [Mycobacterium sp. CBMA 234]|uniref:EspA/EspE family type VII secretion system effector n=1 Tax=Mycolicibacterium sp. CBMA 234 TaxID=1918495 RepID=UPI001EE3ED71|nr:EspA/EspE family type VII secretion system effector [Mycolicibacterium sp. CBMA 234]MUL66447.1 hypothetical protein [Mycolicibacterium sp. CBMA 234]
MKDHPGWAVAGLGSDFVSGLQTMGSLAAGATEGAAAAKFAASIATPVINAGLLALMGMTNTCGFGKPNDGWQFNSGADGFKKAAEALDGTKPPASWAGGASDTYGSRNEEHQQRVAAIAEADQAVQKALADEAGQVVRTRETLDHMAIFLGLCIPIAIAMNVAPAVGTAASQVFQIGVTVPSLATAAESMAVLMANSGRNSAEIDKACMRYSELASASKA